jgi:hypothetical protein
MAVPTIAPVPMFPETADKVYERKIAAAVPGQRGPLRFEEGVATDTDVPMEFQKGVMQGLIPAAGRPNHNANVYEKYPEETMAERAHVGSAAWVEAPAYLQEFAHGSFVDYAEVQYEEVIRSGGIQRRMNPSVVVD